MWESFLSLLVTVSFRRPYDGISIFASISGIS